MFISSIDNSVYSLSLGLIGAADWECISVCVLNRYKSTGRHAIDFPTLSEYYGSSICEKSYTSIIKKVKRIE